MSPDSRLRPESVHLWLVRPDRVPSAEQANSLSPLLSDQELQAHRGFRFEPQGTQFLLTRALVRCVLSDYMGLPPSSLAFQRNRWGRPELAPDRGYAPIRFNVSHCADLIVLGVAQNNDIGVDAEPLSRAAEIDDLSHDVFSSKELRFLEPLAGAARQRLMVELWTLKEAYIKARGRGLSLPLKKFSLLPGLVPIRLECDKKFDESAERWHFSVFHPTPGHVVSLAIRRPVQRSEDIAFFDWCAPS